MCVTVLRSAPKIDPRSMLRTTTAAFPISIFYPPVRTNRRHTATRLPEQPTCRPLLPLKPIRATLVVDARPAP
jgi:hypothetical protein